VLTDPNDLVEDSVFLVLNDPPVIDESAHSQSLILASSALQELFTVWPNERNRARRDRRPERRFFAVLEYPPHFHLAIVRGAERKNFEVLSAVSADIGKERVYSFAIGDEGAGIGRIEVPLPSALIAVKLDCRRINEN
jgi:hypothetical protein